MMYLCITGLVPVKCYVESRKSTQFESYRRVCNKIKKLVLNRFYFYISIYIVVFFIKYISLGHKQIYKKEYIKIINRNKI